VECLGRPAALFCFVVALQMGVALVLAANDKLAGITEQAFRTLYAVTIGYAIYRLVDVVDDLLMQFAARTESKLDDMLVPLVRKALRIAIVVVVTLFVLQNIVGAEELTTLLAGLGVGGLAVALAAQDSIKNFFGSVMIFLDKPFQVGDQLRIDDIEGTVEHIGIKSTRLRSLTGEQVILSNADVLKSRVRNLGRMVERRALFRVGVTYETPPERLEQVGEIIRRAVESVPHTRFLQCPLISLGADSLEFELIFFVENLPDVGFGLTIGEVNKRIFREFAAEGIQFAYPTRRLLVEQAAAAR